MEKKHRQLNTTQQDVIDLMRKGGRLWSYPDGFELNGATVRTDTVSVLLELGYIDYDGRETNVQCECSMSSLGLTDNIEISGERRESV